jgi:hypothetical protein
MLHDATTRSCIMEEKSARPSAGRQLAPYSASRIARARTTIAIVSLILILSSVYFFVPIVARFSVGFDTMGYWKSLSALLAATPLLGLQLVSLRSTVEGLQVFDLSQSSWTVGNAELGIKVPAKVPSVVGVSCS